MKKNCFIPCNGKKVIFWVLVKFSSQTPPKTSKSMFWQLFCTIPNTHMKQHTIEIEGFRGLRKTTMHHHMVRGKALIFQPTSNLVFLFYTTSTSWRPWPILKSIVIGWVKKEKRVNPLDSQLWRWEKINSLQWWNNHWLIIQIYNV